MITLSVLLIMTVWIASIFSFARWRASRICQKQQSCNVSSDLSFQIYLKISGLCVLLWIGSMLARV